MQQKIKCRWLHRSFVFLLSILVATSFMMPGSFGAFGAEKANAATPTVLNDLTYVQVTDDGEITSFNVDNPNYPKDIIIPRTITKSGKDVTIKKIGNGAFATAGLTSVQFGTAEQASAIEEIGEQAFQGARLSSLSLPTSLKSIGKQAFQDAGNINTLDMSNLDSLETIPELAFTNTKITKLVLPKYIKAIEANAFSGTGIQEIGKIKKMTPSHTLTIGENAFDGISPSAVIDLSDFAPNSIEGAPWAGGNMPAIVKWNDARNINNPDNPDVIEKPSLATTKTPFLFDTQQKIIYGLKDDLFATATTDTTYDGWNKTNAELTIPSEIGGIAVEGFAEGALARTPSSRSIKTIKFGADHTMGEIASRCFYYRNEVEEIIDFPKSVKTLRPLALRYMSNLKSLVLPEVTNVEREALGFAGWGKCQFVTFETKTTPTIESDAFSRMASLTDINLREIKKDDVKGAPWGADYSTVNWRDGDTTITEVINVNVDGVPWSFRIKDARLMQYLGELKHVESEYEDLTIPSEVTIGEDTYKVANVGDPVLGLFAGRSDFKTGETGFRNIIVSEGIRYLGSGFRMAKISGTVELPSTLKGIGWQCFNNANLSKMPKLPNGLTNIGGDAFFGNTNIIGTVTIPGNVTTVDPSAFRGCTGITGFDMRMYKSTDSDEYYSESQQMYLRAHPQKVVNNAPYGAPNVGANNVKYVDTPGPEPKHKVDRIFTGDKVENKVRLTFQGYTSNDYIMVKKFEKGSGMPDFETVNIQRPDQGGTTEPSTATMIIESKSVSGKQGGNGAYKVNMRFGDRGVESDERDYNYAARVDAFKELKYDLNPGGKAYEGSAPVAADVYVQGYEIMLPGQGTMKVPGYKFAGWNTKADGSGTPFVAGEKYAMDADDTTLYAQWVENKTSTTFEANGGKWSNGDTKKTLTGKEGTSFEEHENYYPTPEMTGYTLEGWSKSKTDSSQRVNAFGSGTQTVYAVWGAKDVSVTFDGNALDARVKGQASYTTVGKVGAALTAPTASETTRTGYDFQGWAETRTGTTPVAITKYPNSKKTYYAIWKPKQNTINFTADAKEGKVTKPEKPLKVDSGSPVGIVPEAKAEGGYTFTGYWICSVGNARLSSAQVAEYVVTGQQNSITFTAEFKENDKVVVTYDYDGGVDKDNKRFKNFTGTAGAAFVSSDQLPTPTLQGYRFNGWSDPKPTVYPNKDQTIFAKWEPKENTVNFVVPNGSSEPESTKVKTGNAVGITPKATPGLGYTFNGQWKCDEDDIIYSAQQVALYPITGARETITFTAQVSERPDWFALEAAIQEGEAKIAGDEKDKYTETSVKALEDAIAHAKDVLNNADSTDEQLIAEKAAIEAAVKALKTKEQQQAEDALAKAKEDAKAELDKVDVNLYEEPELSVVKKAIEDGKKEIDAATTIPQVDAAKKKALDIIAAQKTAAQKQAERDAEDKEKDEDPKNIPTEVTDKTPANLVAVTKAITTAKNDGDLKGSTYAPLKFMSKKQTKKSIKLQWSKVKGAKQYTVYANQCGTKNKYKKLATVKGKTLNVKKVAGKKLKKGANYKFLIIAENGDKVSAISKTLHIRTAGHKKYTNYKSVSVKKTVIKKAKKLKRGKTLKLNAKGVVPKGKKVSVHVKTRYESANKKVATVTKAGKVKGIKKGKAKIYCYVQNGLAKVVTVTVK